MKKILFLVLSVTTIVACTSRTYKKKSTTVGLKGFYSYYNTLFNSKEALQTELDNRNKTHKDNFYSPYIRLRPEDDPLSENESGFLSEFVCRNGRSRRAWKRKEPKLSIW